MKLPYTEAVYLSSCWRQNRGRAPAFKHYLCGFLEASQDFGLVGRLLDPIELILRSYGESVKFFKLNTCFRFTKVILLTRWKGFDIKVLEKECSTSMCGSKIGWGVCVCVFAPLDSLFLLGLVLRWCLFSFSFGGTQCRRGLGGEACLGTPTHNSVCLLPGEVALSCTSCLGWGQESGAELHGCLLAHLFTRPPVATPGLVGGQAAPALPQE